MLLGMAAVAASLALWLGGSFVGLTGRKPLILQLSWRAAPLNGGFVQAVAKGYYRDCGLDVELRQGGSGIDISQLLVGGHIDAAQIPSMDSVLYMNKAGFPARAVLTSLQHPPTALLVHADSPIRSVEEMRGRPIMITANGRAAYWPFLKMRYGFTDDQVRPNTGLTAFINDPDAILSNVITDAPYAVWQQAGLKVRSFMSADHGYDPYSGLLTVSQATIDARPEVVRCLVRGSQRGWADFMRDPEAGFAEILRMAPEMTRGMLEYGHAAMREKQLVETSDTALHGVGSMTELRWRGRAEQLTREGLLPHGFDVGKVYDTQFLAAPGAAAAR